MRKLALLLAGVLIGTSLACSGGSSYTPPPPPPAPAKVDFVAFVKTEVVKNSNTTEPVDISATEFTNTDTTDEHAFDSVLGN